MSVLANEVYEFLEKTGRQVDKYQLQTKFMVNNHVMTAALEELKDKLANCRIGSHRMYFVAKHEPVAPKPFIMKPYIPPATLVAHYREIEAQRAAFPSRFD